MSDILSCPQCHQSDRLATVEKVEALAECSEINIDGPEFTGDTEVFFDTSETVGVHCRSCDWEVIAPDWIDKLARG